MFVIVVEKSKSKISKFIHAFMEKNKFIEVETPILSHSTIEGAKDYLIPSRIHEKAFYALPQSPQIFKQLLMIAGIDRYYQIAKCFRDEDLRSDRQPEFTQVDCELCFADEHREIFLKYTSEIIHHTKAKPKNTILITIETNKTFEATGKLRLKLGLDFNLTRINEWQPAWIVNYPLFKLEKNNKISSMHHPFSAPKNMDLESIKASTSIKSTSYDLVINGYEIGSGSSRIHKYQIQKKIFEILGMDDNKQKEQFGFFLNALRYGAPPHAGFAFGLDRLVMLISNTKKIRDVIAFPKTTSASDLMTNSPKIII
uniref:Aminoacyl-transfer RNA synthetases class-II family profile domain-containing protein n=1 Tax=Glossina palpalis gambiensis TaxID=67801 RepID=A0A1B0C4X5_9MUSC